MEKITVKNKPWVNMVYATLCLIVGASFIWIGVFYVGIPEIDEPVKDLTYWLTTAFLWFSTLLFWILTILILWGIYYFFRAAFDYTPTIIFDDEGISSKYFFAEKVYWNEIEDAFIDVSNRDTIILKIADNNKLQKEIQSSKLYKKMPNLAFNLSFIGADMQAVQALEIIEKKITLSKK